MGTTAIIMSKEEAMALPLKERPICFRLSSEMYHDVWQAIGAASMCWNPPPLSETFDASAAEKIAVDLLFKIADEKEGIPSPAPQVDEPAQGTPLVVEPFRVELIEANSKLARCERELAQVKAERDREIAECEIQRKMKEASRETSERLRRGNEALLADRDALRSECEKLTKVLTAERSIIRDLRAQLRETADARDNAEMRCDQAVQALAERTAERDDKERCLRLAGYYGTDPQFTEQRTLTADRDRLAAELEQAKARSKRLEDFANGQRHLHSISCDYPEGCSCGATRRNQLIDDLLAANRGAKEQG